jgi:polyisoprenoid-binding protein YceI
MKTYIFLCLLSLNAFAGTWVSNKDHSEVMFQVPYMTVSELSGRFGDYEARIDFDGPKNIQVTIETTSIDTGNKMRDGHLRGADFFESREYPQIIFIGRVVTKLAANSYKVLGVMKIKNISKEVSVEFSTTASVKDTWGYQNRFVKFKSKINRKDFNIKWNKTLDEQKYLVGDEITFWGVFQMQPIDGKTPPSKHMIPDTEYIREREQKTRNGEKYEESSFAKKFRRLINGQ